MHRELAEAAMPYLIISSIGEILVVIAFTMK
jgi:hypothetical protein